MLKHITLNCFRKHESLHVEFSAGLSVVRAPNEGGKSSLLEAIAYALYGTKVLRTSLDDAVTWGHAVKELKVELLLASGGKDYLFTRSKAGAEVKLEGQVYCTGQAEVSALAATLIGADAPTAQNLMLSNQSSLRGVLTSGPKATAAMIESLGDFDLFDRLLEAAQSRLALGSPAMIEARIERLAADLAELKLPARPDEAAHTKSVETLKKVYADEKAHAEQVSKAMAELAATHKAESERRQTVGELNRDQARINRQLSEVETDLKALDLTGEIADTDALSARIDAAAQHGARRAAYVRFCELPEVKERVGRARFGEQMQGSHNAIAATEKAIGKAQLDIEVAKSKQVAAAACGYCGQNLSEFPEVATRNLELQITIDARNEDLVELKAKLKVIAEQNERLRLLAKADDAQRAALKGIGRYLDVDETDLPATVSWSGAVPEATAPAIDAMRAELSAVRAKNNALTAARAKQETLRGQQERLNGELASVREARAKVTVLAEEAFVELSTELHHIKARVESAVTGVQELAARITENQHAYDEALRAWQQGELMTKSFNEQIAQAREELVTLEFNNQLIKKVRSARPVVGNKLWAMVLASVSTIFSTMRGEQSVVSREAGGFTVNGQNVESLSGSTLDLLGLAIRTALIRTFIPACPLLVLDEPGASMDSQRELALLGYLASSTFSQILLVTHSDATESMGNNVIRLSA